MIEWFLSQLSKIAENQISRNLVLLLYGYIPNLIFSPNFQNVSIKQWRALICTCRNCFLSKLGILITFLVFTPDCCIICTSINMKDVTEFLRESFPRALLHFIFTSYSWYPSCINTYIDIYISFILGKVGLLQYMISVWLFQYMICFHTLSFSDLFT